MYALSTEEKMPPKEFRFTNPATQAQRKKVSANRDTEIIAARLTGQPEEEEEQEEEVEVSGQTVTS